MANITAADVKALRDRTGAGMMDCKKALEETGGDLEKAIEFLRKKGIAKAEKRVGRAASEGRIVSLTSPDGRHAVLLELNSETDFVARNDEFVSFAKDIALHIAAAAPRYVSEEEIPAEDRDREARIFEEQAADKPENIRPKIVEGQLRKWYEEVVLLDQPHVNTDKYEGKTIKQLQDEIAAETGENVGIRRFARFAIGQ